MIHEPDTTSRDENFAFLTEVVGSLLDSFPTSTTSSVKDDRVLYRVFVS